MRLTFEVGYHTRPGQELFLTGAHEIFGAGDASRAIPMEYHAPGIWRVTLIPPESILGRDRIEYGYLVRGADGSCEKDWHRGRLLDFPRLAGRDAGIRDSWNSASFTQNTFLTQPFQKVLLRQGRTEGADRPGSIQEVNHPIFGTHTFNILAPWLDGSTQPYLIGAAPELGQWDPARAVPMMSCADDPLFTVSVDLSQAGGSTEYKYGIRNLQDGSFTFEDGPNRATPLGESPSRLTILNDGFPRFHAESWKGAGVAIPVFSLRSAGSFGIGDFGDIKLLADWGARAGLRMIQILPVNDTTASHTWTDSYPYAAISAFALHPAYLDLRQITATSMRRALSDAEPLRLRLNELECVDHEEVMKAKIALIKVWFSKEHKKVFRTARFQEFHAANKDWLAPYAVFCVLRDRFATADFSQWPEHRKCDPDFVAQLSDPAHPDHDAVAFHWFVQFQLHTQLEGAASHTHERGLVLKGDIAIGVNRHGADTWQSPELYRLEMQAGAPPDAFAVKGQNWGFPTYNWPCMEQDGFSWWSRRFEQMGRYFDAFRIDHILGFFRIWSIPLHAVEGILGYFVPALPVQFHELPVWGISCDRDRLLSPWISESVLDETFGSLATQAMDRFVFRDSQGILRLHPHVATQRQVELFFHSEPQTRENQALRQGLFDLIANVILIQPLDAPDGNFHFRIGMRDTSSFQQLPQFIRDRLSSLYDDYFFRRQEPFWMAEGLRKLPALKEGTSMLICGEDLGMVPDCVPEVMRRLGLLCLEVQRMPKRLGMEFSRPAEAQYLAVVTPSTHDMSPIRAWWQEDKAVTGRFFNQELSQSFAVPGKGTSVPCPAECTPEVATQILAQHLSSPAMWSVFQLQDLLAIKPDLRCPNPDAERINIPAITPFYWRYRMHIPLERLLEAEAFNEKLRELLARSGRAQHPEFHV